MGHRSARRPNALSVVAADAVAVARSRVVRVAGVKRDEVRALLAAVADGGVAVDAALDRLAAGPLGGTGEGFTDLGFARPDTHRGLRTGDPEVVYGAGKTVPEVVAIVRALLD